MSEVVSHGTKVSPRALPIDRKQLFHSFIIVSSAGTGDKAIYQHYLAEERGVVQCVLVFVMAKNLVSRPPASCPAGASKPETLHAPIAKHMLQHLKESLAAARTRACQVAFIIRWGTIPFAGRARKRSMSGPVRSSCHSRRRTSRESSPASPPQKLV